MLDDDAAHPCSPSPRTNKEIPAIAQHLLMEYAHRTNRKRRVSLKASFPCCRAIGGPETLRNWNWSFYEAPFFRRGEYLMEKDLFFHADHESHSFFSFLKQTDLKPPIERNGNSSGSDSHSVHWIFFLAELVHRIKNPLVSIKTFTQLLREKFNDGEYRDSFYRIVSEDIEKIDVVLNGLLNYVKMNTPLNKTNTVHDILEEVLKRNEAMFEEKKVKIFKKFERDLPETMLHDEQLKYIFHSLLQYILPAVPPNGSIGFLTKSWVPLQEPKGEESLPEREKESIEVLMVFTGFKRPVDMAQTVLGVSSPPERGNLRSGTEAHPRNSEEESRNDEV